MWVNRRLLDKDMWASNTNIHLSRSRYVLIIIYISNVLYIQYIKSVNVITVIIMASVGAFLCNTTKQFARYRLLLPPSLPRLPLCTLVNLPVFFTFAYHCIFYFAETLCHRFSVEITYLQYQYTADKHVCSVCDRNSRKIQKNTFLTGQTHSFPHSLWRHGALFVFYNWSSQSKDN